MPKELDWQRKIAQSAKKQGGYGRKWSSTYAVGVPDLILSLPSLGVTFMEVKLEVAKGDFDRKLDITERQRHELASLSLAGARACLGVVVYRSPLEVYLAALPWSARRMSTADWGVCYPTVRWKPHQGFDLKHLISARDDLYRIV